MDIEIDPNPDSYREVMEDNVEKLMTVIWDAEEATATVERDLGDDQYQLYVTYEGELDNTDKRYVHQDDEGYQAVGLGDMKDKYTIECFYLFISDRNAAQETLNELSEALGDRDGGIV